MGRGVAGEGWWRPGSACFLLAIAVGRLPGRIPAPAPAAGVWRPSCSSGGGHISHGSHRRTSNTVRFSSMRYAAPAGTHPVLSVGLVTAAGSCASRSTSVSTCREEGSQGAREEGREQPSCQRAPRGPRAARQQRQAREARRVAGRPRAPPGRQAGRQAAGRQAAGRQAGERTLHQPTWQQ